MTKERSVLQLVKWRELIDALYRTDGPPLGSLIGELVQLIKKTRDPALSEEGLLLFLHSSKAQSLPVLSSPVRGLKTGKRVMNLILDAAALPRTGENAQIIKNALPDRGAVGVGSLVEAAEAVLRPNKAVSKILKVPYSQKTEAEAQASKRARANLGIRRKTGRPKSNAGRGQKFE